MAKNIKKIASKLGATIKGNVPDYSPGAFGAAKLAIVLQERLEPSLGRRPGRPTNPDWTLRPKVPMAAETDARLRELARLLSDKTRRVSPMQVAAQLLEEAAASYFGTRTGHSKAERK